MKYNKLVRDKIPKIIKENGGDPKIHIANSSEYWEKLKEKLLEEVDEFFEARNHEEAADILEVLGAIFEYLKLNKKLLKSEKTSKALKRGKFKKKIILEEA